MSEEKININETQATSQAEIDDIMKKYDRESNTRVWEGIPKKIVVGFMAVFSIYCIYMTLFSTALPETRLSLFLGFILVIGYLNYPITKKNVRPNHMPWYDIVLMVVGAGCFFYYAFNALNIIKMVANTGIGPLQVIIGVIGILAMIELCRRCVGVPILCVLGALLVYAFINQFTYGASMYKALRAIINKLFYSTNGIIGTPTNVCYTYIVLFIIFGAFLERTGIANFFIDILNGITNVFGTAINWIIRGLNKISFEVPDWVPLIGGKKWGFDIPKIKKFENGGVLHKETLGVLAEYDNARFDPEIATKESEMAKIFDEGLSKWVNKINNKSGKMSGTMTLVDANGVALGKVLVDAIDDYSDELGYNPL